MSGSNRGDKGPLVVLTLLAVWIISVSMIGLLDRYGFGFSNEHLFLGDGVAQWLMAILAIVATGVSVVALVWLKGTWEQAKRTAEEAIKANKIAKNSSERQLRAYVSVMEAELRNFKLGQEPQIVVTMKNCGQTPAYAFRAWIGGGIGVHDPALEVPEKPIMTSKSESVVGPGGQKYLNLFLPSPLTDEQFVLLEKGSWSVRAVGGAVYRDAFGETRELRFNLYYGGGLPLNRGLALTNAHHGNEAD